MYCPVSLCFGYSVEVFRLLSNIHFKNAHTSQIDFNLVIELLVFNDQLYSLQPDKYNNIPSFERTSATDFFVGTTDIDMNFDWVSNESFEEFKFHASTHNCTGSLGH